MSDGSGKENNKQCSESEESCSSADHTGLSTLPETSLPTSFQKSSSQSPDLAIADIPGPSGVKPIIAPGYAIRMQNVIQTYNYLNPLVLK